MVVYAVMASFDEDMPERGQSPSAGMRQQDAASRELEKSQGVAVTGEEGRTVPGDVGVWIRRNKARKATCKLQERWSLLGRR